MIRALYSLALWLAQPLLRRKLARRGRSEPGYLQAIPERFGHYTQPTSSGWVWVHAVSLGETRAAAIALTALRAQWPGMRLLLTHGTATGRAEGLRLLQAGDVQVWQPWDTPAAVQRFLQHFRPQLGVLVETEVWPNMVALCRQHGVPLALVNARMSEKSLRAALRLAWLSRPAYRALAAVYAQTDADSLRLRALGAPVQGVLGNLKFDAEPDAAQVVRGRSWRTPGRPVVMLASSREGEELECLQCMERFRAVASANTGDIAPENRALMAVLQSVQWLIVPRHPQRFDAVVALAEARGMRVARRSRWQGAPVAADLWVGDSLGEMALYYGLAQVALLGGSFAPLGGQNLIEAAACACPVIMGPHTFNFAEAAEQAIDAGAAWRVVGWDAALHKLAWLLASPHDREAAAAQGLAFAARHRGTAVRTAQALAALRTAPATQG